MNFVTFVFSLLLIFTFGTLVILEKQSSNQRLRNSYLGHLGANRKLLSQQVSETYQAIRGEPTAKLEKTPSQKKESKEESVPDINPECARLNLWPLIQEGRESHPFLYQTALHMLESFYANILHVKADVFLNTLIKKAKLAVQKQNFSLEKLTLDPSLQLTYYKMLKGTKVWDKEGFPSFLDVFKIDENPSKVCIHHAHPGQLNAIFGNKVGTMLYQEIHQKDAYPDQELLERVYSQCHLISPDPDLYQWIAFGKPTHSNKGKMTFIAKDTETKVTLRKTVYIP